MTPHSVGRCPKDRGDRSQLGKPFFNSVFLNITCKTSVRVSPLCVLFHIHKQKGRSEERPLKCLYKY